MHLVMTSKVKQDIHITQCFTYWR